MSKLPMLSIREKLDLKFGKEVAITGQKFFASDLVEYV